MTVDTRLGGCDRKAWIGLIQSLSGWANSQLGGCAVCGAHGKPVRSRRGPRHCNRGLRQQLATGGASIGASVGPPGRRCQRMIREPVDRPRRRSPPPGRRNRSHRAARLASPLSAGTQASTTFACWGVAQRGGRVCASLDTAPSSGKPPSPAQRAKANLHRGGGWRGPRCSCSPRCSLTSHLLSMPGQSSFVP